jgi:hypothetical protein
VILAFLHDLPLLAAGAAIVGGLMVYALAGVCLCRKLVLPRLRIHVEDGEFSGAMLQAVMVFYGLAAALIAVNVWSSYAHAGDVASQEATAIAVFYRSVDGYPEPLRSQVQGEVRAYTEAVIHEAWPAQKRGELPTMNMSRYVEVQRAMLRFIPATENDKILQAAALRAYHDLAHARRLRLDAVGTRLPGILWFVIVAGALVSLAPAFFFRVEDARLHAIQTLLVALFIGVVIFMILALDRPFHGELGVGPESYQLVYDQLMKL